MKKLIGKGKGEQLLGHINELITAQMTKAAFVGKYGQSMYNIVNTNFVKDQQEILVKHRENLTESNEELMAELKPIKSAVALFCAAFN